MEFQWDILFAFQFASTSNETISRNCWGRSGKDSEQFVEAIMEDINDVVNEVYNAMAKVDSESEEEVENLDPGDAPFNTPDEVHE